MRATLHNGDFHLTNSKCIMNAVLLSLLLIFSKIIKLMLELKPTLISYA